MGPMERRKNLGSEMTERKLILNDVYPVYDEKSLLPIILTFSQILEATWGLTGRGTFTLTGERMERILVLCEKRNITNPARAIEASLGAMLPEQQDENPQQNFRKVTGLRVEFVTRGENYIALVPIKNRSRKKS